MVGHCKPRLVSSYDVRSTQHEQHRWPRVLPTLSPHKDARKFLHPNLRQFWNKTDKLSVCFPKKKKTWNDHTLPKGRWLKSIVTEIELKPFRFTNTMEELVWSHCVLFFFIPCAGRRGSSLPVRARTTYSLPVTKHPFTGCGVRGKCRSPVKCAALWCINKVSAQWLIKGVSAWGAGWRASPKQHHSPCNMRAPHRKSMRMTTMPFDTL